MLVYRKLSQINQLSILRVGIDVFLHHLFNLRKETPLTLTYDLGYQQFRSLLQMMISFCK